MPNRRRGRDALMEVSFSVRFQFCSRAPFVENCDRRMEYSGIMLAQQDDNHDLLKNVADFQRTKPRTLEELQRGFRDTSDAVAFDLLGKNVKSVSQVAEVRAKRWGLC